MSLFLSFLMVFGSFVVFFMLLGKYFGFFCSLLCFLAFLFCFGGFFLFPCFLRFSGFRGVLFFVYEEMSTPDLCTSVIPYGEALLF